LQQALPPGTHNLGIIGEPIPANMRVTISDPPDAAKDFADAKLKLNGLANAIFADPSCDGLYSPAEQRAVKELVINRALGYLKEANVDVNDAMKLVRDNLIKIHHQQTVDHKMVTGSDHGCENGCSTI
jgi:hypothetical protein